MQRPVIDQKVFFIAVVLAMSLSESVPRTLAQQPADRGQGGDPCRQVRDSSRKAHETENEHEDSNPCPAPGSSSGVTKGDFNNDGFTDLAIGEPGATIHGHAGAGDVVVLYGSANGLGASKKDLWYEGPDRNLLLNTLANGNGFGSALASGDFNGDGFTDLAIGAPNEGVFDRINFGSPHAGAGAVTVIYGSANGLTTTDPNTHAPQFLTLANTDDTCLTFLFCTTLLDNAHFGQSLTWGNFNGDKLNGNVLGDLAIGAPSAQDRTHTLGQGAVVIVWGRSSGLAADNTGSSLFFNTCCVDTVGSQSNNDAWGAALSSGDFDADGSSDLAIGVPGRVVNGSTGAGAVFILTKISTHNSNLHAVSEGSIFGSASTHTNAGFGGVLASGDFDGDLRSDLAIGLVHSSPNAPLNDGALVVLYGAASGITDASRHQAISATNFHGSGEGGANFAGALVAGDFDGDGASDLVIGVPGKDIAVSRNGQSVALANAGEINVIYGSPTGLSLQRTQIWNQETLLGPSQAQANNRFGAPLTAWNFGNNEVSVTIFNGTSLTFPHPTTDLAVGVPFQTVSGVSGAGAVDVFFGSFFHGGLGTTFTPKIFTAGSLGLGGQAGAHFGAGLY